MINFIIAGLVAGLGMALSMGIGEKLGLAKINLPRVDGAFFFKDRFSPTATYLIGLIIHSFTSIGFAIGYLVFTKVVPLNLGWVASGLLWAGILWVAFGFTVSPVTGYGLFGFKAGKWTWLELLVTHAVYGLILTGVLVKMGTF